MKYCPTCGSGIADEATFCPTCGTGFAAQSVPNPGYQNAPNYGGYAPAPAPARPARKKSSKSVLDTADHTAEFDKQDISDNKVVSMLIYLAGYIGIFVALLLANTSKYVSFHVRQALKIEVTTILWNVVMVVYNILTALICGLFSALWAPLGVIFGILFGIIPLAGAIALLVIKVLCFVQICKGQAKEPVLISKIPILK